MTAPNRDVPDRAYVGNVGSGQHIVGIQSWDEASIRAAQRAPIESAWGGARGNFFGNIIGGLANAINGVLDVEAFRPVLDAFRDFQRALNDRLDLLENVSGHCNLVMASNWTLGGGKAIPIPFDSKVGPNKRARPYYGIFTTENKARYGILLEAAGTWRADTQITFGSGNGERECQLYLSLWDRTTRTVVSEKRFDTAFGRNYRSQTISDTFVVPEGNRYVVCVSFAHGALWWPILGGDRWSRLSVNRWDIDASGRIPGTSDPSNGGNYT